MVIPKAQTTKSQAKWPLLWSFLRDLFLTNHRPGFLSHFGILSIGFFRTVFFLKFQRFYLLQDGYIYIWMITWTVIRHIMLPVWTHPFAACRVIDMCKSRLQNDHSLAYLPSKHTTVSAMPFPRSSLARANANANSTHRIACRSLAISTGSLGKVA